MPDSPTPCALPKAPLMTAAELAELLSVSVSLLYRMADAGRVPPPVRLGPRTLRWDRDVVARFLSEGGLKE